MKVRMKHDVSGLRGSGGEYSKWPRRGEVLECSDAEGADLCSNGLAEPVKASVSKQVKSAPERATKRDAYRG